MNIKFTLTIAFCLFSLLGFGQDYSLNVTAPANIAGNYVLAQATFGAVRCDSELSGSIVLYDAGVNSLACNADGLDTNVSGAIALVDRGECAFDEKALNAQNSGAIAVIICDNTSESDPPLLGPDAVGDDVTIPTFGMTLADCETIRVEIANGVSATTSRETVLTNPNPPTNIVWSEDFSNGIGSWESIGLTSEVTGVAADEVIWNYSEKGTSFFGGSIFTDGGCDGVAEFDFFGYQTMMGSVEPTVSGLVLESEFISPTIDLSGVTTPVQLSFVQFNVPLNGVNTFSYSSDNGATWSDPADITTENVLTAEENNIVGNEFRSYPLPGLSGSAQAKIRFTASGDFYTWLIDDVAISPVVGVNIGIENAFYTPLSYAFPSSQGDGDEFFFSVDVTNLGDSEVSNTTLTAVVKDPSGNVLATETGSLATLGIGATENVATDNTFIPAGLTPGVYTIDYEITVPNGSDTDLSNNTATQEFEVTETTFAKEDGTGLTAFRLTFPNKVGNMYFMSGSSNGFTAESITFAVASEQASIVDNFVNIYILKLNDDVNPFNGDNFDDQDTDLNGHPSFEVVAEATHSFTNENNFDLITVPFTNIPKIKLDGGAFYFAVVEYNDIQTGAAVSENFNVLNVFKDEESIYPFTSTIIVLDETVGSNAPGWYLGGIGNDALIRMNISLSSPTDETPLPENSFKAFPNPARDIVTAELEFTTSTDVTFVIATMDGKVLRMENLQNVTTHNFNVDVSNLPSGPYLFRATTEEGTTTKTIVVQH